MPLALLVRQVAEDRALSRATDVVQADRPAGRHQHDPDELRARRRPASRVPVTVFLPDGAVLGAPATADGGGAAGRGPRGSR